MSTQEQPAPRSPGVRARRRAEVERRIVEVGREHLARHGAAGLTVRGVARDLGMAPSALFRYVDGLEDLLTTLIVACYEELGEQVEAAVAAVDPADAHARWWCLARECRSWALGHPHDWALLFGSPVPAYDAPPEVTTPAGTRVPILMVRIGQEAGTDAWGDPVLTGQQDRAEAAVGPLVEQGFGAPLDAVQLLQGMTAWTLLVGAVSAEVFELFGPGGGDHEARFEHAVEVAERVLFSRC
jgi:AcrR family transcriptional regulator